MQPGLSPARSQVDSADWKNPGKSPEAQLASLEARMDQLQAEVRAEKQDLLKQLKHYQQQDQVSERTHLANEQQERLHQLCQDEAVLLRADFASALEAQQQQVDSSQSSQLWPVQQDVQAQAAAIADLQQRLEGISSTSASSAEQAADHAMAAHASTLQALQQKLEEAHSNCVQATQDSKLAAEKIAENCESRLESCSSAALARQQEQAAQQQAAWKAAATDAADAHITASMKAQQKAAVTLQEQCRSEAASAAEAWLEQALQPAVEALQESWQQSLDRATSSLQVDISEVRETSSKGISSTARQMQEHLDAALLTTVQTCREQAQFAIREELSQSRPPGAGFAAAEPAMLHPRPDHEQLIQNSNESPAVHNSQAAQTRNGNHQQPCTAPPPALFSSQASSEDAGVMSHRAQVRDPDVSLENVSAGQEALPDVSDTASAAVAAQQHQINGLLAEVGTRDSFVWHSPGTSP